MATEFRVLGPLELRRDGEPVVLQAAARRRLLAALLIEHGRVVSVDRLVDALWPESPPHSVRGALQMTVSRTRKLVGDDGVLVARPPGYILEVDPAAIDAVRFERLLVETRELVASDPARAAARATDALSLWRGGAYEEFAFDAFATEEIARLDELRLEAEEERIEAELALGRSAELVGDLEALVEAEPLRERRRGQLMRALYRSGRQADALAAFRDARRLLLDELGIEPGPELRELERAILNQEASLDAPGAARPTIAVSRRPVSVVVVEPVLPLDVDLEEHERRRTDAAQHVERVATHFEAMTLDPFVFAFVQEDHEARAAAAAREVAASVHARVGTATAEALVGDHAVGGPIVEAARARARDATPLAPGPADDGDEAPPFVGRERELERLHDTRAAVVTGPPGIGKSRLVREATAGANAIVVRCPAFGAEALAPLHDLVRLLGVPEALDGVRAADVPLTVRHACEAAAPVLVVVDDLQWGDALVHATVEQLATRAAPDVRVLVGARDELLEEHPSLLADAERVALEPLDDAASRALAGDDEIAERAEGNPLFIEQLRAHAAETDAALPPTLYALLAARLDRLTPTERAALQRASVVGRDFDAALLDAPAAVESLVRRSLLLPARTHAAYEERFRFAHALIREAAYESIPKAERSRLHETLADELAARGAADEVVGSHLERAAELRVEHDRYRLRLAEDAGRALGAAGYAAWNRGDAAGAVRLLRRALALRPDGALACELGIALSTLGRHDEAVQVLAETEASAPDRRIAVWAHLEQGVPSFAPAAEILRRAEAGIPVFDALGDDRAAGRAWMLAGWVRGGAFGRHDEWLDAAERALGHYVRAGFSPSTCVGHIAAALYFGPTPVDAAITRCRTLLVDHVDDVAGEAGVSAHLGGLVAMTGAWDEATALLERARSLYGELGRWTSINRTCAPIEARVARLRGDLEAAEAILRENCDALTAEGAAFHLATQAAQLADVLLDLGAADDARTWLALAERSLQDDDLAGRVEIGIARARLTGEGAADVVALAEQTENLDTQARALLAAGDVAAATERYRRKGNAVAAAAATAS
jgi:DNA-binding SARP family transcriptional activator